jgi:hypothetical protein
MPSDNSGRTCIMPALLHVSSRFLPWAVFQRFVHWLGRGQCWLNTNFSVTSSFTHLWQTFWQFIKQWSTFLWQTTVPNHKFIKFLPKILALLEILPKSQHWSLYILFNWVFYIFNCRIPHIYIFSFLLEFSFRNTDLHKLTTLTRVTRLGEFSPQRRFFT